MTYTQMTAFDPWPERLTWAANRATLTHLIAELRAALAE